MDTSNTITELAKALSAFQGEIKNVKKDAANPYFRSRYASLENVWDTIRAKLKIHGLAVSQFPNGENELITILMHSSGEWMRAAAKMTPKDATPQGQGSAITYMRRYALSAVLGLATEEDDDGAVASGTEVRGTTGRKTAPRPANSALGGKDDALKANIYRLLTAIFGMKPQTEEEVRNKVLHLTQLELLPANYEEIASRLSVVNQERNEKLGRA